MKLTQKNVKKRIDRQFDKLINKDTATMKYLKVGE